MIARIVIALLIISWFVFPQGALLLAILCLSFDLFRIWFGRWSMDKRNSFRWTFVFILLFLSRAFRTGRFRSSK